MNKLLYLYFISILLFLNVFIYGEVIVYQGVADDPSLETAWKNGALLNQTLAQLQPGDELLFPNVTIYLVGGIIANNLQSVTLRFDGTLIFTDNTHSWPKTENGQVLECFQFNNFVNVTLTSSHQGLLDGQGEAWWGLLGYVEYQENRPRMLSMGNSKDILLENLYFKNSPYWTVWIYNVDGLEIRYSHISNRRNDYDGHDDYNMEAFNTDGFDVTGKNVWIHDCTVWNQDDCIAVKDGSENMLIERVNASGVGLTIGSIGGSDVRNITFRDCYMHKTFKGIYMKFRGDGLITDVLYENIVIYQPEQWATWIGPAQQADNVDICLPAPCSLCWPMIPFAECNMPNNASYIDITLRNIEIIDPKKTGVIIGSETNPMINITFDNVVVQNAPSNYFECKNVQSERKEKKKVIWFKRKLDVVGIIIHISYSYQHQFLFYLLNCSSIIRRINFRVVFIFDSIGLNRFTLEKVRDR
ncbi:hypothetical protein PPL_00747 [Heterostelium album PN500]|uniref:Polygalacturonase n=1 Tax=Heterostelium pallidum (strain ATCC 26659 / Pp 5 / PN500) TaxID=670386 RepID=D3AXB6_HETP5|nr:hypothetical protein PPL_00747 [Heterostelium album PN500]EFA86185.1 hypothetical protein PPL_00747 [Heterostelium album PN500]|eukprot:XP_020438290.1 hypothetical protein PPL_00747 [Heterostelium album PN500]